MIRYDACLRLRRDVAVPRNLAQAELPAGRVAVFEHRGPHRRLPETYDRIFGAWLPASPEQLAEFPPYEVYPNKPGEVPDDALRTLIHIPLAPRQG